MSENADSIAMQAIAAIGKIQLRDFPEDVVPCVFHEAFESDIKNVNEFCKVRSVFGHSGCQLLTGWDTVCYLRQPYFLFYLPSILLQVIQHPATGLASVVLNRKFKEKEGLPTNVEQEAIDLVGKAVLASGQMVLSEDGRFVDNRDYPFDSESLCKGCDHDAESWPEEESEEEES